MFMFISFSIYLTPSQCKELNNSFGTEIALFFSRSSISHSYNPGVFATEGAEKWLERAQIGHNTPKNISI